MIMPPRYFLRCLGLPELRGPGGEPIRFRTKKQLALLAYLAVEPRQPHRRDRLADLLWPEASPAEGRHSLATALSLIRGKLGPRTFESGREAVRFVAPDLEVDLDRLAGGNVLGDEMTPPLEVGGFLDDFEVGHAAEFMLWREARRAHWFPAIRQAFVVLMDRCRRTGDFARIEPLADRLLSLDELSEDAIRAKMEGRAFAGDRLSALRIFQGWQQKLNEILGATPSPIVEGMALRLRQRGYEPPGTSHIPTVPTDQWRGRAFIGRANQYRTVYERWEETARSRGRHALVLGDSGIGKTTLVERLVTAAGLEGAVSSRVQCYEVEREIPYAAIGTLVRGMLDRPGAGATAPEWLAELARMIPAVANRFPNLPPARETERESARLRLTEGVHQLATAVADEHPLILVVDDVHLADDASVAVLHLLMRRTQEQRIMLVLTARQAELSRSPHAGRLMSVREALALEPVDLPPLTDDEMSQVVSALADTAGRPLLPAVRRALLRASAGVPMIAELLFDDWCRHGDHCLALSVEAMTVDPTADGGEIFGRILDRVFEGLSSAARAALNLAAILGVRLNDLSMYELVDLTLAQTLAGMAELTERRIMRDGGRDLEFRNELLRGKAYLSVPSPLRRALHGLIADRLQAAEAGGEAIPGLMLAWHCYRAGRPEKAVPFLLRGSREAIRHGGPFEVELALSSAMATLASDPKIDAQLLIAESQQEQGRWLDSLVVLEQVLPSTESQQARRTALDCTARSHLLQDEEGARGLLKRVKELRQSNLDCSARARLLVATQRVVYYLIDRAEAEDEFDKAKAIVESSTDIVDRIIAQSSMTVLAWITRRTSLYPALCLRLHDLACEGEAKGILDSHLARLYHIHGCLLTSIGRYSAALDCYKSAYSLARKHGDEAREVMTAGNMALCHGRLGQYVQQEEWAERALAILAENTDRWQRITCTLSSAKALTMQGHNCKALSRLESTPAGWWIDQRLWATQASGLLRADVYLLCGEVRRAVALAEETLTSTGVEPISHAYAGTVARWVAATAVMQGRTTEARSQLAQWSNNLSQHDAVDQAEILGARLWLERHLGNDWPDGTNLLAERCASLPGAIEVELKRLLPGSLEGAYSRPA